MPTSPRTDELIVELRNESRERIYFTRRAKLAVLDSVKDRTVDTLADQRRAWLYFPDGRVGWLEPHTMLDEPVGAAVGRDLLAVNGAVEARDDRIAERRECERRNAEIAGRRVVVLQGVRPGGRAHESLNVRVDERERRCGEGSRVLFESIATALGGAAGYPEILALTHGRAYFDNSATQCSQSMTESACVIARHDA